MYARRGPYLRHAFLLPTAVFPKRFMSDKQPLPEPTWKQDPDLDNIVPSNFDQATGLERAEMLAEMEGRSIFEEAVRLTHILRLIPLKGSKLGTRFTSACPLVSTSK